MSTKIGLYFQLEMQDSKDTFTLIKMALNRLEKLKDEGVAVEYLELRLTDSQYGKFKKQAFVKLDGNGRTVIDSETSTRWQDAFSIPFDRIGEQFRSLNTDLPKVTRDQFQAYNAINVAV